MKQRITLVHTGAVLWSSTAPEYTWGADATLIGRTDRVVVVHTGGRSLGEGVYLQAQYHVFEPLVRHRDGTLTVEHLVSFPVRREATGPDPRAGAVSMPWREGR